MAGAGRRSGRAGALHDRDGVPVRELRKPQSLALLSSPLSSPSHKASLSSPLLSALFAALLSSPLCSLLAARCSPISPLPPPLHSLFSSSPSSSCSVPRHEQSLPTPTRPALSAWPGRLQEFMQNGMLSRRTLTLQKVRHPSSLPFSPRETRRQKRKNTPLRMSSVMILTAQKELRHSTAAAEEERRGEELRHSTAHHSTSQHSTA